LDEDQSELGIKNRGGAGVEIKGLVERRAATLNVAGCSGPIEIWAKWAAAAALNLSDGLLAKQAASGLHSPATEQCKF
jgi:hypothetical protein